jgi:transposase
MISLPPSVRIYLCAQSLDGRKGIDALSALVRSSLGLDPLSGHLFLFFAGKGRCARILFWDHNGFVLYSKRLEKGRFHLPKTLASDATHVVLEPAMLTLLLEGIDLSGATTRARWTASTSAPDAMFT